MLVRGCGQGSRLLDDSCLCWAACLRMVRQLAPLMLGALNRDDPQA